MTAKAAVLGAQEAQEAHFTFPIVRKRYTPSGDLEVYGPCTDGSRDSDHQKVDPDWSAKALRTWIDTGGNVRVQHSPFLYPAGRGLALEEYKDDSDAHWLKALVLQSTPAFDLVEKGVLRDFSIGVLDPVTMFNDPTAPAGTICGGEIGEVSLVDRGSNKNTSFTIVKAARKGPAELVLRMTNYAPSPSGVGATKAARIHAYKTWIVKRKTKDGRVVDSSGKDRSSLPGSQFAGPGKTYPIENRNDVTDAASLAHHADDPASVRANIKRIAREHLGMSEDDMPPSLKADTDDDTETTNKGPFPGARPPFGKKPKKGKRPGGNPFAKGDAAEDYPGDRGDDGETVAEYNADDGKDDEGKDDDQDEDDKDKASQKAIDARKLRKRLIKQQRRVLELALKGGAFPEGDNGGDTPADSNWHPDPEAAEDHPTGVKDKHMKPAGEHREPDGDVAEEFEEDAGMTVKSEAGDASFGIRQLHDAVCPAFAWKSVRKAYGLGSVEAAIPERELQTLAMKAIGDNEFDLAAHYTAILDLVGGMQSIGPEMLLEARKAFPELYPNVHPRQQHDLHPSQFSGGYLSAGHPPLHASGVAAGNALASAPVHHVSASQFQRGFISPGHASTSPGDGTQATGGTAAFGQALNTLASTHTRIHSMFPEICPLNLQQMDLTQAEGQTGIRSASMQPAPARSVGEPGRSVVKAAGAASVRGPEGSEPVLRKKLAKAQRRITDLQEENLRLGSLPSNDPDDAAYRGVPELSGPVDRKSLVGKSLGAGGDETQADDDEYRSYLEQLAVSGTSPALRMNAQKVLTAMITK